MGYYPVMLDVGKKPVVMVGGGKTAAQKLPGLLAAEARLVVVAPAIDPEIFDAIREGRLEWRQKQVEPTDLTGAGLVICATSSRAVNRMVAGWARAAGQLVNCVDDPAACDVFTVSQIRRGPLVIAVSTSGRAPVLASIVRRQLENLFDPAWADAVREAEELRTIAKSITPPVDRVRWLTRQVRARVQNLWGREVGEDRGA